MAIRIDLLATSIDQNSRDILKLKSLRNLELKNYRPIIELSQGSEKIIKSNGNKTPLIVWVPFQNQLSR